MRTKHPRRSVGLHDLARLKSQVNAIGVIQRLLSYDLVTKAGAADELKKIQVSLYMLSRTPHRKAL